MDEDDDPFVLSDEDLFAARIHAARMIQTDTTGRWKVRSLALCHEARRRLKEE